MGFNYDEPIEDEQIKMPDFKEEETHTEPMVFSDIEAKYYDDPHPMSEFEDSIGFKGKNFYLSNFYPCKVMVGINKRLYTFRSSEAAFQACKCPERAAEFTNLSPSEAKKLGRRVELREDWEDVKVYIMYRILECKFTQNPELLQKLVKTDPCVKLVEYNTWGDQFWGVFRGVGLNVLGQLLMVLRSKYTKPGMDLYARLRVD